MKTRLPAILLSLSVVACANPDTLDRIRAVENHCRGGARFEPICKEIPILKDRATNEINNNLIAFAAAGVIGGAAGMMFPLAGMGSAYAVNPGPGPGPWDAPAPLPPGLRYPVLD